MNKQKAKWIRRGRVTIISILVLATLGYIAFLVQFARYGPGIEYGYQDSNGHYTISDAARISPEYLINNYGADFTPQWSADGRIIVAAIRRGIKGVSADGNELWDIPAEKQEQHTYGVAMSPSLSATGRVAYVIYRDSDEDEGIFAIETAAADGSGFEKFSDISDEVNNPVWSPDGSRLAFTTNIEVSQFDEEFGRYWDVVVDTVATVSSDGSSVIRFPVRETWSANRPVWSNNGQRLAYVASRQQLVNALWDGTDEKIALESNMGSFDSTSLSWSPTDDRIYFVYYETLDLDDEDEGYLPSIRSVRPDGSDERIIALWRENSLVAGMTLSPDGSELLFTTYKFLWQAYEKVDMELFVVKTDGSEVRKVFDPINDSRFRTIYASWSPDGSRIAVQYLEGGPYVFTMAPDGTDTRMLIKPNLDGLPVPGRGEPLPEALVEPTP